MPCSLCLPSALCDHDCDGLTGAARWQALVAEWHRVADRADRAPEGPERDRAREALRAFEEAHLGEIIPW